MLLWEGFDRDPRTPAPAAGGEACAPALLATVHAKLDASPRLTVSIACGPGSGAVPGSPALPPMGGSLTPGVP